MTAQSASALALGVACAWVLVLFVRGSRRPAVETRRRSIVLGAGLATLVGAQTPLVDALAERSFAWHMVQHLALVAVAAPLIVLADPVPPIVAGLRPRARARVAAIRRRARAAGLAAAPPAIAFCAHMGTLVAWHAPPLFDAALRYEGLHALEHATFVGTALVFWAQVLTTRGIRRIGEPAALVYLLAAGLVGSSLGALLTLSGTPWYGPYVARLGPVAALHDQQVAGLVMWIPPGALYLAVAAVVFARWLERAGARQPFGGRPRTEPSGRAEDGMGREAIPEEARDAAHLA